MNDDTIAILGQFCFELLGDERFNGLITMYRQQCAVDILETQPEHVKKREYIHASYTGFNNFIDLMQRFAKNFEERTTSSVPTDDPLDDPSVHDIYSHEDID